MTEIISLAPFILSSANALNLVLSQKLLFGEELALSKQQILDCSKLKEFADDNFKFDDNNKKISKQVENTVGKREIARYEPFLLFLQCFQKTCTAYM